MAIGQVLRWLAPHRTGPEPVAASTAPQPVEPTRAQVVGSDPVVEEFRVIASFAAFGSRYIAGQTYRVRLNDHKLRAALPDWHRAGLVDAPGVARDPVAVRFVALMSFTAIPWRRPARDVLPG